ncbi:hypothetical protein J6590_033359, partial [Homalodisca vitripennis]
MPPYYSYHIHTSSSHLRLTSPCRNWPAEQQNTDNHFVIVHVSGCDAAILLVSHPHFQLSPRLTSPCRNWPAEQQNTDRRTDYKSCGWLSSLDQLEGC